MATFDERIGELTDAVTGLTNTVNGKLDAFEARVSAAEATYQSFITQTRNEYPMYNMLPNNGRYDSSTISSVNLASGSVFDDHHTFVSRAHFNVFGASVEEYARHFRDSITYGGSAPIVSPEIIDFWDGVNAIVPFNQRFSVEFRIAKYTAAGLDGFHIHPQHSDMRITAHSRVFSASRLVTYGQWVKVLSGELAANPNRVYINGEEQVGGTPRQRMTSADGWFHISLTESLNQGYNHSDLLYATSGAEFAVALPFVTSGHFGGAIHTAPVQSL